MNPSAERDAAYEKGYLAVGESLSIRNASLESAEHTLELRLGNMSRSAYNRGGNDAVRDYIQRLREARPIPPEGT